MKWIKLFEEFKNNNEEGNLDLMNKVMLKEEELNRCS